MAVDSGVVAQEIIEDIYKEDMAFLGDLGVEEEEIEVEIGDFEFGVIESDLAFVTQWMGIRWEEVDREFVFLICDAIESHQAEVAALVNAHVHEFRYEDMDTLKKALFVLGYTEHRVFATDTKVIINEMIELAKRFGSVDTFKLVNGVFHRILVQN